MNIHLQESKGDSGPFYILTDQHDYTAHLQEISGPSRAGQIVRAVNTFDEAKAALNEAVHFIADCQDEEAQGLCDRLEATLAKMEGR